MTDNNQLTPLQVRKALVKQQMEEQRQAIRLQAQPLVHVTQRVVGLFKGNAKPHHSSGKVAMVTGAALVLAMLGKRRGGWLGKMARYAIINYPGLLHRFIK